MNMAMEKEVWIVNADDSFKGFLPEKMTHDLVTVPPQLEGTWCTGDQVLKALKEQGFMLADDLGDPQHFPHEWEGYQIAFFARRFIQRGDSRKIQHVRVYTLEDGRWTYRMKSFESDFNVRVKRLENLKIPIVLRK